MTYASTIVEMLQANEELVVLLSGGIYDYPESGRKGINRTSLPQAYESGTATKPGLLKPLVIVVEHDEVADGQIVSPNTGLKSVIVPIYLWIYDDGSAGYGTINEAWALIYTLLADQRIAEGFQIMWKNTLKNKREQDMGDACCYLVKVDVQGLRRRVS